MPVSPPVHRPVGYHSRAERRAAYDAIRLSPSRTYDRRWQKLRAAYLATHPLCECGCNRLATVVDHKQPHNGDDALLSAWDNLPAMTASSVTIARPRARWWLRQSRQENTMTHATGQQRPRRQMRLVRASPRRGLRYVADTLLRWPAGPRSAEGDPERCNGVQRRRS